MGSKTSLVQTVIYAVAGRWKDDDVWPSVLQQVGVTLGFASPHVPKLNWTAEEAEVVNRAAFEDLCIHPHRLGSTPHQHILVFWTYSSMNETMASATLRSLVTQGITWDHMMIVNHSPLLRDDQYADDVVSGGVLKMSEVLANPNSTVHTRMAGLVVESGLHTRVASSSVIFLEAPANVRALKKWEPDMQIMSKYIQRQFGERVIVTLSKADFIFSSFFGLEYAATLCANTEEKPAFATNNLIYTIPSYVAKEFVNFREIELHGRMARFQPVEEDTCFIGTDIDIGGHPRSNRDGSCVVPSRRGFVDTSPEVRFVAHNIKRDLNVHAFLGTRFPKYFDLNKAERYVNGVRAFVTHPFHELRGVEKHTPGTDCGRHTIRCIPGNRY